MGCDRLEAVVAADVVSGFEGPALPLPGGLVLLDRQGALLVLRALLMVDRHATASSARLPVEYGLVLAAVQAAATSDVGRSEVPTGLDLRPSELAAPMTAAEVGKVLGCTTRNVIDLRARGTLPAATRAGRQWLFDRLDVAALKLRRNEMESV